MDALSAARAAMGRPAVQSAVSMAASLLLLLAFHQTVTNAVQRAEVRRQASTQLARAVWQCHTIAASGERRGCLARLGLNEGGPSAGCDARTPDGSACVFGASRKTVRTAAASWM